MSEGASVTVQEAKRGGGVVFVAIFLGPFIAVAGVILSRVFENVEPLQAMARWAPVAALVLVHWVGVTLFVEAQKKGTANVFVWSLAAALADLMWYGVLLSLVDAYG